MEDNKSCKAYFVVGDGRVYFSGDFDNGNLEKVEQLSSYMYRVYPGYDRMTESTRKTFFHFKVQGFKMCVVEFQILRMHMLQKNIKFTDSSRQYHPVYRTSNNLTFTKVPLPTRIYYNLQSQPEMAFSFQFKQESWAEFSFSYPYSYEDCQQFVEDTNKQYIDHPRIYFNREVLCKTSQTRCIYLINITARENCKKEDENSIDKPKVVISGRVHPGQAPSSFAVEGIIRMLLDQQDLRSQILRKHFHFLILPMLNPQGVAAGMFRVDLNGKNLNRMYLNPNSIQDIGVWTIKQWLNTLSSVYFLFDFHAHPSRKGFFIYGNAFQDFAQQVQAQVFSKVVEANCPYFEHQDCIYSQKAMRSKDKFDSYSKEGCARVYYHKKFNIVHSYTVECGYFSPTRLNAISQVKDICGLGQQNYKKTWERVSMGQYTPQAYMLLGKSVLISLLDLFNLNPFSRVSEPKSLVAFRRHTAQRIYTDIQRYRLIDPNCYRKVKAIHLYVEEEYYKPRFANYNLSTKVDLDLDLRKFIISKNNHMKSLSQIQIFQPIQYLQGQQIVVQRKKKHSPDVLQAKQSLSIVKQNHQSQLTKREIKSLELQRNDRGQLTKVQQNQHNAEQIVQNKQRLQHQIQSQLMTPKKNIKLQPYSTHLVHQQLYNHFQKYDKLNSLIISRKVNRVHSNQKICKITDYLNNSPTALNMKSSLTQNLYQHSLNKHLKMGRLLQIESELTKNIKQKRKMARMDLKKQNSEKLFKIKRIDAFLQRQKKLPAINNE